MEENKFCGNCGSPRNAGALFCGSCGMKFHGEQSAPAGQKSKFAGLVHKKWIMIVAALIVVCSSIGAFATFGGGYSAEDVLRKTLELESGRINFTITSEEDDGETEELSGDINFKKGSSYEEKQFFMEAGNGYGEEQLYFDIRDGLFSIETNGYHDSSDLEKLGMDIEKLQKELIDFIVASFTADSSAENWLADVETSRKDGKTIINGRCTDERRFLEWLYDSVDQRQLHSIFTDNMPNGGYDKDYFESAWEDAFYNMDDQYDSMLNDLFNEETTISTSPFTAVINKDGTLDSFTINCKIQVSNQDPYTIKAALNITDKNEDFSIRNPFSNTI